MDPVEGALTGRTRRTFASAGAFLEAHLARAASFDRPVDRAIAGGALADRIGYAFIAGYAAALQALVPDLGRRTVASLAATEERGAHPRAIRTTLTRTDSGTLSLRGHKRWVTLAGTELLVLATTGTTDEGRASLVVVRIPRDRPGVRVVPHRTTFFVPEIPHAEIVLEDVFVSPNEVLPGDGWARWVKPFRTVEDIHVHAAFLAHLCSAAAHLGWDKALRERIAALLVTARALAAEDTWAPSTHLALAGLVSATEALTAEVKPLWEGAPLVQRERWSRDLPLLQVASRARQSRTRKAWDALEEG